MSENYEILQRRKKREHNSDDKSRFIYNRQNMPNSVEIYTLRDLIKLVHLQDQSLQMVSQSIQITLNNYSSDIDIIQE